MIRYLLSIETEIIIFLLTCICLIARCYSIKKIQCNTVTSLQCCSLCLINSLIMAPWCQNI